MDPSSLPKYLQPTPPPASPMPPAARRGWTMLLQFLFLIALWGGLYVLREQALAFSNAYKREEAALEQEEARHKAEQSLDGKWQSTRVPEMVLEIRDGRIAFLRNGSQFIHGNFTLHGQNLTLETLNSTLDVDYWSLQFQAASTDLVILNRDPVNIDFIWFVFTKTLGRGAGDRAFAEEKVLRFRRVRE